MIGDVDTSMSDLGKVVEAFRTHGMRAPAYIGGILQGRLRAWCTARSLSVSQDLGQKFSLIYRERWWDKDGESASGPGSTLAFTDSFRAALEEFIRSRAVSRFLDAPCGDWNWFRQVKLPQGCRYIGGDIVPELVGQLNDRFGNADRRFCVIDVTKDALPAADIWLCRDCLAHLSNIDVTKALSNFAASAIPYALLSSYVCEGTSGDIDSGGFRPLDLTKAPFNLPEPEFAINDWPGEQRVRRVGLWSRAQVVAAVAAMGSGAK